MSLGYLADLASLLGLLLSAVGFVVTIRGVGQARRAAEDAKRAAKETLSRLRQRMMGDEIGLTLRYLGELQSACRDKVWAVAILRSGDVIARLSQFAQHPSLTDNEEDDLEVAVVKLETLRGQLERLVRSPAAKDLSPKHRETINAVEQSLSRIRGRFLLREFEV